MPPGDWICNWCKWRQPLYFEMKYKHDLETLPEAQQTQGIESVTQVRDGCKRKSRQAGTLLSLFHCQKKMLHFFLVFYVNQLLSDLTDFLPRHFDTGDKCFLRGCSISNQVLKLYFRKNFWNKNIWNNGKLFHVDW